MSRRTAREKAMQALYEIEISGSDLQQAIDYSLGETDLDAGSREFTRTLVMGTWGEKAAIDQLISKYTRRWNIERLPVIDRSILRLAVFEMINLQDIPNEVSINEAVELAKAFSTEKASAFINAILDSIGKELKK